MIKGKTIFICRYISVLPRGSEYFVTVQSAVNSANESEEKGSAYKQTR